MNYSRMQRGEGNTMDEREKENLGWVFGPLTRRYTKSGRV